MQPAADQRQPGFSEPTNERLFISFDDVKPATEKSGGDDREQ